MNYQLETHAAQTAHEHGLRVVVCGRQKAGGGHAVERTVYPRHSLTFVVKGRGTLESDAGKFELSPGQGFWIEKGSEVAYRADGRDPWEYVFVVFDGFEAVAILDDLGLSSEHPTFSFDFSRLSEPLEQLLRAAETGSGYEVLGRFWLVLGSLAAVTRDRHEAYLDEAVALIENNFDRPLTIKALAEHLFIDRTYLYRLFRQKYGLSPKEYLTEYRLRMAASLLLREQATVTEVAEQCGFFDHAHFIRAFSAKFGASPGVWRSTHTEEKGNKE